jgi:hypothetical protein
MASNTSDRRIALQFVSETLGGTSSTDTILKRASDYAEFLTTGRLPNDTTPEPDEFDPAAE